MVSLKEPSDELRKVPQQYCYSQDCTKSGGQILECYCCLRDVQDFVVDGKTPFERRFGEPFSGPIKPFGAMVGYLPSSPKDQAKFHQFGKKVLPGIFVGNESVAE